MIIDSTLQHSEVAGGGGGTQRKSMKLRKPTENEHVLSSRRAGPGLSGYIRAAEASSLLPLRPASSASREQTCEEVSVGGRSRLVIYFSSLAHASLERPERKVSHLKGGRKRNQSTTSVCHSPESPPTNWGFFHGGPHIKI